jgi:uncharacterized membrane protein YjjP (DUF1212 family)
MNKKTTRLQTRLYVSSVIILAIGLCCALLIYLTAGDDSVNAVSYVVVDGVAYPLAPGSSKLYVRELQRFGGKAAVLFDEFGRWFAGLWQGKTLAITVAWISIFVSLGVFLFARYLASDADADEHHT